MDIGNISTFTNDYFPLQIVAQVSFKVVVPDSSNTSEQFKLLRSFYMNFGGEPEKILAPIIRN